MSAPASPVPEAAEDRPITVGPMAIDPARRKVTVAGRRVKLTVKEFDLLLHFARHPGRVYTRSQLLDLVWGYGRDSYQHTVNSHINRLRSKIEDDPARPRYVLTVWGMGYKLAEPEDWPDAEAVTPGELARRGGGGPRTADRPRAGSRRAALDPSQ